MYKLYVKFNGKVNVVEYFATLAAACAEMARLEKLARTASHLQNCRYFVRESK